MKFRYRHTRASSQVFRYEGILSTLHLLSLQAFFLRFYCDFIPWLSNGYAISQFSINAPLKRVLGPSATKKLKLMFTYYIIAALMTAYEGLTSVSSSTNQSRRFPPKC